MAKLMISVIFSWLLAATAVAAPITILVGDNDGFGAGIPDGGDGSIVTRVSAEGVFDRRESDEAESTNGAQLTDLYTFIFPTLSNPTFPFNPAFFDQVEIEGEGPRASSSASVIFPFTGRLLSADIEVDVLDYQADNYIRADINGIGFDFGSPGAFSASSLRTFELTPAQINEANLARQVMLNLTLDVSYGPETSGDLLAFDFFRLDGELMPAVVPEPAAAWLFATGLIGLSLFARRIGVAHTLFIGYSRR